MRTLRIVLFLLLPLSASEKGMGGDISADNKATIQFLESLRDNETGAFKQTAKDKSSLRATNGAVKSLKVLGQKPTDIEKIQKFILGCYDPKTGAFAEPDGKPDATITSIGIIVACEVGIDKKEFPKAMDYLLENAKTFEEVRIGAAAVEAWGRDGLKLDGFLAITNKVQNGAARAGAAIAVTQLRLGQSIPSEAMRIIKSDVLIPGQCDDGGWRKIDEKASDIESTYRVMRAFKMLDAKPKDIPQLRKFLESHRNNDGGSATKPGDPSTTSGTYYRVIVSKWLDDMEK